MNQLEGYVATRGLKKNNPASAQKYKDGNIFALYDKDDIVCIGTLQEIADKQDYKISTLKFFASESARKRNRSKRLVLLEE